MDRNEIVSYIQSMIQQFYHSNDKALNDKIANSQSFSDLELTPPEVSRLIMSCEEKYNVDLGDAVYPSIQSVVDALMSVADVVNSASNQEESADSNNATDDLHISADTSKAFEDDEKLPPPPETIEIPDTSTVSENTEINIDGLEDEIVDEEEKTEAKESSTEEETSQEG